MDEQSIRETLSHLDAWAKRFHKVIREAEANAVREIGSRARSVIKQIEPQPPRQTSG